MAEPAPLTIRRAWPRIDAKLLQAFKDAPTGFVADAIGRAGALDHRIRPVWAGPHFVGSALPVWTTARDNLAPYAAIRFAKPGDVMLIATGEYLGAAVVGDVVVGMMRNAGIVAAVTDGLVRDVQGIAEVGIPVYAQGLTPSSPFKHGPGTIGLPIAIGGQTVAPGDLVVGDRDGVVIVPRWRVEEAAAELSAVREKEAGMDALVRSGATAPSWLDQRLEGDGVRYVDG
ncbi:MAG TPA: RraA family protein [Beijerinckiaceae bacterium]|jgi:4-hydroxy-4-methyl-2-oxoglutarate aldolase